MGAGGSAEDGDLKLVELICNEPKTRDRFASLELIQGGGLRFGRDGRDRLVLGEPFEKLIWAVDYWNSADEGRRKLARWLITHAAPRPGREGKYLDADLLERIISAEDLPAPLNSVDVARAIWLFAALLKESEARELLNKAAEFGCTPIQLCLQVQHDLFHAPEEGRPAASAARPPRLQIETGAIAEAEPLQEDEVVRGLASDLEAARQQHAVHRAEAAKLFERGLEPYLALRPSDAEAAISVLKQVRSSLDNLRQAEEQVESFVRISTSRIARHLGCEIAPAADLELGARLLATGLAEQYALLFPQDDETLAVWVRAQPSPIPLERIFELAGYKLRAESLRARETVFVADAKAFLSSAPPVLEVTAWLRGLTTAEILLLISELQPGPWSSATAVLVRVGLERRDPEFSHQLAAWLATLPDDARRRRALRFIDPTSSLMDSSADLRRIIAAETVRDAFTFGPIANITDPSRGLSDETLVGRSVAAVVSLVSANLDAFGDPARRATLVHGDPTQSRASADLLKFIQTPATMTGHFRRLRELARETVLLPLAAAERIDLRRAAKLAEEIASGEVVRAVVAELERELPSRSELESQHVTQLHRYLETARKLLISCVKAEQEKLGQHQLQISGELAELMAQLSEEGRPGTQAWLEAQVRAVLMGVEAPPSAPTLAGGPDFASAPWAEADTAWALEELELAEFRVGRPPLLDVCAATLHWWAIGRPPSPGDVAEGLLTGAHYRAALDLIARYEPSSELVAIKQRVEAAATEQLRGVYDRLQQLAQVHGAKSVECAHFHKDLIAALKRLDVEAAEERLELLEIELQEALAEAEAAAANSKAREAAARLLHKLLRAGVGGLEPSLSLADLERRWSDEMSLRRGERTHLEQVRATLLALEPGLPEFATIAKVREQFDERLENPDDWLPSEQSSEFSEFLEDAAGKLSTFLSAARLFEPPVRRALAAVLKAYVDLVVAQTQLLRGATLDEERDAVLEHCYQFNELIQKAKDPLDCVVALGEAGLMAELPADALQGSLDPRRTVDWGPAANPLAAVQDAIARRAWPELIAVCRLARPTASELDVAKLDESAEFARVMEALGGADLKCLEFEQLEIAARAVLTIGHPVHRALPQRDQLDVLRRLLLAALHLDASPQLPWDSVGKLTWDGLFTTWPNVLKTLNEAGRLNRTSRLLEDMLSTSLGPELADRLWTGATKDPNPTGARQELLRFAHDHRGFEAISRLAQRYDPALKVKIDQMLELRGAATTRPDLIAIAEAVGRQVISSAKVASFKYFVQNLPSAAQAIEGTLEARLEPNLLVRAATGATVPTVTVPLTLVPRGIVPEHVQVQLFPEDDVTFAANSGRLFRLSDDLMYTEADFSLTLALGQSWEEKLKLAAEAQVRLRFSAKTVTGDTVQADAAFNLKRLASPDGVRRTIDNDTILEFYPGVGSTPAQDDAFVGRSAELELLNSHLVVAPHPSPVLLTGMRRVGKTSLLYAFHKRYRQPAVGQALTVYVTIAELRSAFMSAETTVAGTLFRAFVRALGKASFSGKDHNRAAGEKLKSLLGDDRNGVRLALEGCWDPESFADSLALLGERLCGWLGTSRIIFLIDEAESLTVPYNTGGPKKLEIEQLLQSLREVAQASDTVALLLSGSNHIVEFAREYKNAFFGSCVRLDLGGILQFEDARKLIAPKRLAPFVQFEESAIRYGGELCAGMPQFMWQLGATVVSQVRSGPAVRADVRQAISTLVSGPADDLPFKPYDVLEPIEHMLKLQGRREEDLLWLLLRRVALNSSLAVTEASHFLIEQALLELDSREAWQRRLTQLVELDVLVASRPQSYSFKVPIFAEAFRSPRYQHEHAIRAQRVAL